MHLSRSKARQLILWSGLLLWIGAIAFVTLRSMGSDPPSFVSRRMCVICGSRGLSDLLANWLLFVPFGLLVAWLRSFRVAILVSIAATVGIEVLQQFLPGRVPSPNDIVMNSLGGLTGAWLARRATTGAAAALALFLAVAAWSAPTFLLQPDISERPLYGHWNSGNPGFQIYFGDILSASLGTIPLRSSLLEDVPGARAALTARDPLEVRLVVGRPTRALAQIVAVYDSHERQQLLLGVIGNDLILRDSNRAYELRLDRPDARWNGALSQTLPGDTVTVIVERGRDSLCMSVDDRTQCSLAPGPGDGWAFLLNLEGGPNAIRWSLAVIWSLGIGALAGLAAGSLAGGAATGGTLALLGLLLGALSPDTRPDLIHALLLVVGSLAAAASRPSLVRLVRFASSGPEHFVAPPDPVSE